MGADKPPFFSILVPSYNRPECIAECIESILANEGEDFEVIISDDASPTAEAVDQAVRPYLKRPNIQFHRQPTNIGEPANRNYLVSQARGRYNIILCDDDKLFSHTLRTLRDCIERQPDQDLYLFGYRVVDDYGAPCYDRAAPRSIAINLDQPELVRKMFEATWLSFLIFHQATFCCKRGIERELPYRSDVAPADDYMFLLECLNKGKRMYVVPECLMYYRWFGSHDKSNQINQSSNIMKVMKAATKVYYAFQRRTDLHPTVSRIIHGQEYRERFLYDSIIRRMEMTEGNLAQLSLEPADRQELAAYTPLHWKTLVLIRIYFTVVYQFVQTFGLKGIVYSIRTGIAYLKY